uniref:Glycerate kinase n=1 Tax=Ditylenchus dipsaci TaxID=166011 RepID=A0A915D6E7_9BILA
MWVCQEYPCSLNSGKNSQIPSGLKTKFLTGALNNLPDAEALENANKIAEFLQKVRAQDQIILFLISGGGSALLPSPIDGIILEEKLEVIRMLATNGADIKQLNLVRSALSKLKGGKLAQMGAPSKMISLIISDVIGDPLQLIASGPTVLDKSDVRTPQQVFDELGVKQKIPQNVAHLLSSSKISPTTEVCESEVDVNNVIVCNNQQVLKLLAQHFQQNGQVYPLIITSTLEGDTSQKKSLDTQSVVELCKKLGVKDNLQIDSTSWKDFKKVVLLFGGETTVKFDALLVGQNCKGGRNQEFVLSTFYTLLKAKKNCSEDCGKYAFFSLGTDGQGIVELILKLVESVS